MSLCPESKLRAAMTDGEFWDHALNGRLPTDLLPDLDGWEPWEPGTLDSAPPCPECGQLGACAYDADGRPLIHATEDDR